jgi:hypothetical protein
MNGLEEEEVECTGINLAQYNTGGDMKETSKENSAADYDHIKKLLEYIIFTTILLYNL